MVSLVPLHRKQLLQRHWCLFPRLSQSDHRSHCQLMLRKASDWLFDCLFCTDNRLLSDFQVWILVPAECLCNQKHHFSSQTTTESWSLAPLHNPNTAENHLLHCHSALCACWFMLMVKWCDAESWCRKGGVYEVAARSTYDSTWVGTEQFFFFGDVSIYFSNSQGFCKRQYMPPL